MDISAFSASETFLESEVARGSLAMPPIHLLIYRQPSPFLRNGDGTHRHPATSSSHSQFPSQPNLHHSSIAIDKSYTSTHPLSEIAIHTAVLSSVYD